MTEHLLRRAQASSDAINTFCEHYNIVLNKHVLRYALLEQLLEEAALATEKELPETIIHWPLHMIEKFIEQRHEGIDHYGLRLRLWHVLYRYKEDLFLVDTDFEFANPARVEPDTLYDILRLTCFQDSFDSYMGQTINDLPKDELSSAWCEKLGLPTSWQEQMTQTPVDHVDVLELSLPQVYFEVDEPLEGVFPALNKGLEEAVKQALEGEKLLEKQHPFKRLFLSFNRPKDQ